MGSGWSSDQTRAKLLSESTLERLNFRWTLTRASDVDNGADQVLCRFRQNSLIPFVLEKQQKGRIGEQLPRSAFVFFSMRYEVEKVRGQTLRINPQGLTSYFCGTDS